MVEYPKDWECCTMESLCVKIGSGATPTGGSSSYCDVGISLIRSQNVLDNYFSAEGLAHIDEKQAAQLSNVVVESHDVLLNITGDSVARVCVVDDKVLPARVNQHVCIIRVKPDECDHNYVCYKLVQDKSRLLIMAAAGATRNALTKRNVEQFELNLPPLPEQKRIAGALGDVDKLIDNLARRIEKKKAIKRGAMQQLLTGKKRLPGFKGEWKVQKLGAYVDCLRGVSYSGSFDLFANETDATIRLLRSNNIQGGKFVDEDVQYVNKLRAADWQVLHRGDILVCMANGSKALVGKTCLFTKEFEAPYTFGAFMGCVRAKNKETEMGFIFQLMNSVEYADKISLLLSGSSINNLRPDDIRGMEFDMPVDVAEQRAIAKVLGDMDAEIGVLEKKLAKLKLVKKGMMSDLLTGRVRI